MLKSQASQYALIFLAVCAAFVALKLAEQAFAPIVLGLVIGVVLAPFPDLLERMRLPQSPQSRPRSQDGPRQPQGREGAFFEPPKDGLVWGSKGVGAQRLIPSQGLSESAKRVRQT